MINEGYSKSYVSNLKKDISGKTNIVDYVVSKGIELELAPDHHVKGTLIGICPFEKGAGVPTLYVNDKNGIYYCDHCKKGGNIIAFVRDFYGIQEKEAILKIAETEGIKVDKRRLGIEQEPDHPFDVVPWESLELGDKRAMETRFMRQLVNSRNTKYVNHFYQREDGRLEIPEARAILSYLQAKGFGALQQQLGTELFGQDARSDILKDIEKIDPHINHEYVAFILTYKPESNKIKMQALEKSFLKIKYWQVKNKLGEFDSKIEEEFSSRGSSTDLEAKLKVIEEVLEEEGG